jgi:hypothetical protein
VTRCRTPPSPSGLRSTSMTTDVSFGREVAATGTAGVLEALDT